MIKMKWYKGKDGLLRFFYCNTEKRCIAGIIYAKDFQNLEYQVIEDFKDVQELIDKL